MNRCSVVLFSWLLNFSFISFAVAQKKRSSPYEISAAVGAFIYQGDLTPQRLGSLKTMQPGFMLHVARKLNSNYALRFNFTLASLYGDDAKYSSPPFRQQRNFNFRTPLIEISPQFVWSPMGWVEQGPRISPYVFAGVGLSVFRIRRDWSNFNPSHFGLEENLPARIAEDMARSTPVLLPVLPAGAGLRYAISPKIVLNGEVNYRKTFSDYIDGFSKAASPAYKDHYYSLSVGAIYRFGRNKNSWDCPPLRN